MNAYVKKILCLAVVACCFGAPAFADELITLRGSNQNISTQGFETNEYDWLINPLYLNRLTNPTLFFALDGDVSQLAADLVGSGFRFGWTPGGMGPALLLNYYTDIDTDKAKNDEGENLVTDYTGYDITTGRYATITESVNENLMDKRNIHNAVLHSGIAISDLLGMVLQLQVELDRYKIISESYTDTYSNTASVAPEALTDKGDLTETEILLRAEGRTGYTAEVEAGLNFGKVGSTISLAGGFYNFSGQNEMYSRTVTDYNAATGLDDTLRDTATTTEYSGQYYYNGMTTQPCFGMNTNNPNYPSTITIALGSETILNLGEGLDLVIPFGAEYDLYPGEMETVDRTLVIGYDDSLTDAPEVSRTDTTTTTGYSNQLDLELSTGAAIRKTFQVAENAAFHLGAQIDFEFSAMKDTRSRTETIITQVDNDGDGAYTTAGIDGDTTYVASGYEIQRSEETYEPALSVPLAVSYSPAPPLTFHLGHTTTVTGTLVSSRALTTGDSGYMYETFTDNLDDTNSYDQRQIDGSDNTNTPEKSFDGDFDFSTTTQFGFTLEITENFKLDAASIFAVGSGFNVSFVAFSLTGILSY